MGDFRARDADRDRTVELIEAAYVDGQLGDADRELRVGRALAAETIDELTGLTRDLQVPGGVSGRPPARDAAPSRPRRVAGVLVGLGLFVVLVGAGVTAVVALAMFAASGPDEVMTPDVAVVTRAPGRSEAAPPAFEMTAPQVRRFLRAYERKFGTLDAWEVGFHPERVGVQVPASKVRKRFARWSWDGTWRQDSEASAVTGPQKFVSLGALDVSRMFDNMARAKRDLDVPDGRLTHVLVNDWGEGPGVNIYIGNRFNESGHLRTTLPGQVLDRFPYDG